MLIPVFLRKVTKYGANGKKRMHQLSFPCRHLTLALAPTPLRTNAPTLTHLLQHFHASAPPLTRIYAYAAAHLRHHSRASAPMPLRTCDTTRTQPPHRSHAPAHKRHYSRAPTTPLSRICAYAAAHKRTHFQAGLRSLLRCFALFST